MMKHIITYKLLCRLLCGLMLALSFTSSAFAKTPHYFDATIINKNLHPGAFSGIVVRGPLNVKIINNPSSPPVQIHGDKDSVSHVNATVKDDTLYIGFPSAPPAYKQTSQSSLLITINNYSINQLTVYGSANVTASNLTGPLSLFANGSGDIAIFGNNLCLQNLRVLKSSSVYICGINSNLLNIQDCSCGDVNLRGTMTVHQIDYSGSGKLRVYWVNSTYVRVTGNGTGRISLAGIAGLLEATLSHCTWLNAKYLHADRAVINTREQATAEVWARHALHTLASPHSNIYYFHNSGFVGHYMKPPARVLRMTHIDPYHLPHPSHPCDENNYFKQCDEHGIMCS